MQKNLLTSEKILEFLRVHPGSSSTNIARQFGVTTVAIFYHLRELISRGRIERIGKSRSTRYFLQKSTVIPFDLTQIEKEITGALEDAYKHLENENIDIEILLSRILLILLPDGEWREWIDALYAIITKENQWLPPSRDLFARRLQDFLFSYHDEEQKRRKNGFFDWTESIKQNLEKYQETCYVDHVYFSEINKLWHWWKLRTGTELYHGKSLQDKRLLTAAIDTAIFRIQQFFLKKWVDAVILTPPTLPRKVQFRDVFMERFWGITFAIRAEKVKNKDFRPQKELRGKDRFINARASIQVDIPTNIWSVKHIVIIDDNFTTGATVNAIGEKLRIGGYTWDISVITLTGNFWYIPWVNDDAEI